MLKFCKVNWLKAKKANFA
jgi:hypothetical protein